MSCWLPVVDQRFKAAVAISPVTDFYSQHWNSNIGAWDAWFLGGEPEGGAAQYRERSPVFLADRVTTPTLLTAGTEDRCTPPGQAIEFFRASASGVPRSRSTPARVTASGSSPRTSTWWRAPPRGSSATCRRGREPPRVGRATGRGREPRTNHGTGTGTGGTEPGEREPGEREPGEREERAPRICARGDRSSRSSSARRTDRQRRWADLLPVAGDVDGYLDAWASKGAPDHVWFEDIFPRMAGLKRSFAALAGCDTDEVALTTNISIALSTVASPRSLRGATDDPLVRTGLPPTDTSGSRGPARPAPRSGSSGAPTAHDPDRGVRARDRRADRARDGQPRPLPLERSSTRRRCARSPASAALSFVDDYHGLGIVPLDLHDLGCDLHGRGAEVDARRARGWSSSTRGATSSRRSNR